MSATQGIDFARLTLKDALDLAVLVEEEARERYEEFADQMELHHTPEAASFFRFMSRNEEKHRTELASRRATLFRDTPSSVTRAMIFDIEAPEYDEARAFMTAREALQAALRSEVKAAAFFAAALPRVKDTAAQSLFEDLRKEELEHQKLVERELERLPPESNFAHLDLADDPVGL